MCILVYFGEIKIKNSASKNPEKIPKYKEWPYCRTGATGRPTTSLD